MTLTTAGAGRALASPWRTFWLASAAVFLVLLDTTAVVAAYAPLRAHFSSVSVAELPWTLNAYTVLYAALLVPAGRLAGLLGRKRLFLLGLALFSAASALCALAPGIGLLIAARALQALGNTSPQSTKALLVDACSPSTAACRARC